ncbi:hypothetical protein EYF80_017819 [Liparis tanakae]|uniref:Uncharacterized protein n=1 Tax=Liparis tanakae TaxID=230148 RepID=A0A4Z2I2N1_9TELE|nr:hypothetical protein EYF80_017819 [Liparis tanakae]
MEAGLRCTPRRTMLYSSNAGGDRAVLQTHRGDAGRCRHTEETQGGADTARRRRAVQAERDSDLESAGSPAEGAARRFFIPKALVEKVSLEGVSVKRIYTKKDASPGSRPAVVAVGVGEGGRPLGAGPSSPREAARSPFRFLRVGALRHSEGKRRPARQQPGHDTTSSWSRDRRLPEPGGDEPPGAPGGEWYPLLLAVVVASAAERHPEGRLTTTLLLSRWERGGRQGGPLEMAERQPLEKGGGEDWRGVEAWTGARQSLE